MRICTRSSWVQLKYLAKEELTETNYRNFKHFFRSRKLFRRSSMFVQENKFSLVSRSMSTLLGLQFYQKIFLADKHGVKSRPKKN